MALPLLVPPFGESENPSGEPPSFPGSGADWPPRLTLVPPVPRSVPPTPVSLPRVPPAVYRRRRLGVLIALGLLVAVGLGVLGTPWSGTGRSPLPAAGTETAGEYVVQPGDTLWSIAAEVAPDRDRRVVVDRLAAANGGPELRIGQRLVIAS